MEAFTDALGLKRYAIYVFDYGAPTGFRLAMSHPERIAAIVSQNGNAYEQGLGDAWAPIRKYWSEPSQENRDVIRQNILNFEGTRWQYTYGVADPESVAPESYTLDAALLERPGNKEIQLDLFLDYESNVKLYPKFQDYLRWSKPPLLAIWGKNDPFFIPAGAEAFEKIYQMRRSGFWIQATLQRRRTSSKLLPQWKASSPQMAPAGPPQKAQLNDDLPPNSTMVSARGQ